MRSRTLLCSGLAAVLALVVAVAGCGKTTKDELVIGEYGSLTGGDATFGQSTKAGVEVALDELTKSAEGKIGGMTVRAVVEDDQGRPEEAASVVQKLINQDRVIAVVGEVASSRSLAGGPICQQNGVPMISPSSTNPGVTQIGDFIFRMCYLDDFQGAVMARFTAQNLGLKRVAMLKDIKNDYSVALAQYFTEEWKKLGGTILIEQSYQSGDQDFRAQLTAIKARNPEAIILPGYYTEAGLIGRQARELGLNMPIIGGDGWESAKLIEIGGEAMNGCYYANHWSLDQPNPKLQAFLTAYRAKFNTDPDAIGGLAYDAATVLFGCMQRLAADDPATFAALGSSKAGTDARKAATAKLRDLIAATANYEGATGMITLDENRNPKKPIVVIAVKGGKKVFETSIAP
ncbi:MAG TPA: ABC transporter substrate-binding protein [Candidatus Eisenbacteria bacterium]|nr:ABC transporter substrate-binding protein [Candidatus Eisenbacteria bacterium]